MHTHDKELALACKAAQEAGKLIARRFGSKKGILQKSLKELVTLSDMDSQTYIIKRLSQHFPAYEIIAEEKKEEELSHKPTWIVDPLDGTHNFVAGIPFFGVSIALYKKELPLLGAVYFPLEKKLFSARKGGGAYCNGKKLQASSNPHLGRAMIAYDNQFRGNPRMLRQYAQLQHEAFTTRILGCATRDLCFIAEGVMDGRVFNNAKLCDIAAAAVILREAGGSVTNFSGMPVGKEAGEVVASNGHIHKQLLRALTLKK